MRIGYKSHRRTSDLRYLLSSLVIFAITFLATVMTLSLASAALASTPTAPDWPATVKLGLDAAADDIREIGGQRPPALLGRADRFFPGSGID
ncbi:MAG: hypothetical protein ACSHW2_12610, partial [Parasphingopyxis sp.]